MTRALVFTFQTAGFLSFLGLLAFHVQLIEWVVG